jgi:hypothetical protein
VPLCVHGKSDGFCDYVFPVRRFTSVCERELKVFFAKCELHTQFILSLSRPLFWNGNKDTLNSIMYDDEKVLFCASYFITMGDLPIHTTTFARSPLSLSFGMINCPRSE